MWSTFDRGDSLSFLLQRQCAVHRAGEGGAALLDPPAGKELLDFLELGLAAARGHGTSPARAPSRDLISKKFFDRVNHDRLMARVAARVTDKRVLKLIRAFLKSGVMEDGLVSPVDEGAPQGGLLSPLLSNLVLDELDKELTRRGHRFCRRACPRAAQSADPGADDCNIYVRSRRAGERAMASVSRFVTKKLRLKVNEAKSGVARPEERKFLGFRISNDGSERRIAPKALDKFKTQIREMTRRTPLRRGAGWARRRAASRPPAGSLALCAALRPAVKPPEIPVIMNIALTFRSPDRVATPG